jgi:hypothetical protein
MEMKYRAAYIHWAKARPWYERLWRMLTGRAKKERLLQKLQYNIQAVNRKK